jgi:hypothetical protein
MKLADYARAVQEHTERAKLLLPEFERMAERKEAGETGPEYESELVRLTAELEANTLGLERLNAQWKAARRRQGLRTVAILVAAFVVGVAALALR